MTYLKNTNKKTLRLAHMSEYAAWWNMLERCNKPTNPRYHSYGGRGITVCAEWLHDFDQFVTDMGPRPSAKHSLERADNNLNYEPSNCKWATAKEQMRNRRCNRILTVNGESKTVIEWAEQSGLSAPVITQRIDKFGWSVEDAVLTPADTRFRHNVKDHSLKAPTGPMEPGRRRVRRWFRRPDPVNA